MQIAEIKFSRKAALKTKNLLREVKQIPLVVLPQIIEHQLASFAFAESHKFCVERSVARINRLKILQVIIQHFSRLHIENILLRIFNRRAVRGTRGIRRAGSHICCIERGKMTDTPDHNYFAEISIVMNVDGIVLAKSPEPRGTDLFDLPVAVEVFQRFCARHLAQIIEPRAIVIGNNA